MNALEIKKLAQKTGQDISVSVLDLPLDKQQALAKREGFDDVKVWQEHARQQLQENKQFSDETEIVRFDTIEEAQKAGYTIPRWHNESINARPIHWLITHQHGGFFIFTPIPPKFSHLTHSCHRP